METHIESLEENAVGIDVGQITDAIWDEMHGQIDKCVIRQTLEEMLPKYQNARVRLFVPILIHREVVEILHHGTPFDPSPLPA